MKRFLNYYRIITNAPQPKSVPVAPVIAAAVLYVVNILLNGENGWLPFVFIFAFVAGLALFRACYAAPNLEKVFPASHNKKLLYRFMSALALFLTFMAVMLTAVLIVALIVQIFVPTAFGEIIADCKNALAATGVYGGLFGAAYLVIMYSAGMITGFIKRRKARNIFLLCLCVALFLSNVFMGLPFYYDKYNPEHNLTGPFSKICYDAMALPWLAVVIWFIIAGGMLGAAIYLGVKHYDPKKF